MPIPVMAALAALQVGKGLYDNLKGSSNPHMRPFSYTPNEMDPELLLRRRLKLQALASEHGDTINEIGRAGLLGSSASFGVLGAQQDAGAAGLENISADVFGKRRAEALDLYTNNLNFSHSKELAQMGYNQQDHLLALQGLSDASELGGTKLDALLKRKKFLEDLNSGDLGGGFSGYGGTGYTPAYHNPRSAAL